MREYVYLDDAPLAQVDAGSPEVLTYIHTDHLGTPRYGTNTAGASVWAWAPDAFGISTPTGSRTVNLRLPGQYYDAESGLHYNWNRYYKPSIGRYISSDPIGIASGDLNTFSYVTQSPVMWIDIMGLDGEYGILQALFPATTSYASRNPIGGSPQAQLGYAEQVSRLRQAELSIAGLGIGANSPAPLAVNMLARSCLQCGVEQAPSIQFGGNAQQQYHAFRHTDAIGLNRSTIQGAIKDNLSPLAKSLPKGQFNGSVDVNGIKLNYSAYKLPNGTINVGRITPP